MSSLCVMRKVINSKSCRSLVDCLGCIIERLQLDLSNYIQTDRQSRFATFVIRMSYFRTIEKLLNKLLQYNFSYTYYKTKIDFQAVPFQLVNIRSGKKLFHEKNRILTTILRYYTRKKVFYDTYFATNSKPLQRFRRQFTKSSNRFGIRCNSLNLF